MSPQYDDTAKHTRRMYSASLPGLNLGEGHNVTDQPVFYRVGRRGRALLFALPEHRTVSQQAQPATPAPSVAEEKQPKSPVKSDKQKQPDKKWSVGSEHVLGFIDWLSEKEKAKKGFNSITTLTITHSMPRLLRLRLNNTIGQQATNSQGIGCSST